MPDIVRRWARRAAVALFAGGLASFLYYALGFVRVGLSAKLLGDAYRLAYRFIDNQASPSGRMRRLVTFCLIQAFGTCLVLIEVNHPGDALGAFLLLPGFAVALSRNGGGATYFLSITLCVNAIAWFAGYTLLGRFKAHRKTAH